MSSPRFTFVTLLLFIAVFFGAVFYVKPLFDEVNGLSLSRDEKVARKDQLMSQLEKLRSLQKSFSGDSEVSQRSTLNAIPERFEQDKLLSDLTLIAQNSDVVINNYNFNIAQNSSDKVKRATLNLNLTGTDASLIAFLKSIENNQRKMVVKTISVTAGKANDDNASRVNFNVSLETYYQSSI